MDKPRFFHNPTLELMRRAVASRKEIRECSFDGYIIFSYFYTKSDTFGESEPGYVYIDSQSNK